MKEKAVHPLPGNGRGGGSGNRVEVSCGETAGGSGPPSHAVSQRNDITFLVANEENVLDGLPFTKHFSLKQTLNFLRY